MNSQPWNALRLLGETMPLSHSGEAQQELAGSALSVIVPTFNEGDNIIPLVERPRKRSVGSIGKSASSTTKRTIP